jgi:hypothetical protein
MAGFSAINVGLTALWIAVVLAIGREHARRSGEPGAPQALASPAVP